MHDKTKIQYAVDENPPLLILITQALQHLLAAFSALIILPTVVANIIGTPTESLEYIIFAGILVTALTTYIQSVRIGRVGAGYILFTGAASSFLACSISAAQVGGFALVATMTIIAAPIEFLFAYFLGRLRKIVTPVVGGVIIMIISITLIPIALEFWVGTPGSAAYQHPQNLFLGLVTFVIIAVIFAFGKPAWRLWGPAAGIAGGYIFALALNLVDLSRLSELPLIGLPRFHWPGFYVDLSPQFFSILMAFIIVTIVGSIETVGDVMAVQRVSKRDFKKIDYDSVQGALYTDAIGNIMAGLAGTLPNSTFSGNTAVIEMTGVASRKVGVYCALFTALLAFFPWLSAIIIAIPEPILGAMLFILFSFLFVTGLKLATHAGLNHRSAFIVGISFWIGFAAHFKLFFSDLIPSSAEPFLGNGVAVGGITAFLLSIVFSLFEGKKSSLVLEQKLSRLNELHQFIRETGTAFTLTEKTAFQLQLLCEELFIYLKRAKDKAESSGHGIRFSITADDEGILVEVEDRSVSEDIDGVALPADLIRASSEELDQLGLALLAKIAFDVVHTRIAGVNYISFRLANND